mmetsp:Transcript_18579/g.56092  ORF Transcript_18579/g.56092 Transcript_18579/m.56092 type:complete len:113 (-) Transcript_18579:1001-1339(-)
MAGDVNLFFNDPDEPTTAEIEVMIAERASRRKGLAGEAIRMLMAYGATDLGVKKYRAKIGLSNSASLALFQKLGFQEVSRSSVFQEATLEWPIPDEVTTMWLPSWHRSCYSQ